MVKHREETLEETLNRLHHLYEKTQNPLYAWEGIYRSLSADEPIIPDWCIPYLHRTAFRLMHLASGHDFSNGERGGLLSRISSDQAMQLVTKALSLSRQGKRNAFAALLIDRRDMNDARNSLTDHQNISLFIRELALKRTEKKRSVSRDRAERIIARGKRLLRLR